MIPSFFVQMEQLPVTINGKLDRKALPEPDVTSAENYVAPENDTERAICEIFGTVLGLEVANIGADDDFFKMGGDSISSIQLVNKINNHFNCRLTIGDLLNHNSANSLSKLIVSNRNFNLIVPFTDIVDGFPNLYMIHPGGAGCDVYRNVSKKLAQSYNCFGIDSYNLYSEIKITNIHDLAMIYLDYINKIHNPLHTYNLFGWSLGGQIGLEIASILEENGVKHINLYLLDTILWGYDEKIQEMKEKEEILANSHIEKRFEGEIEELYETDRLIANHKITCKLKNSKIILFKAADVSIIKNEIAREYIKRLKYNNIEKVIPSDSKIKVVQLSCHHYNILENDQMLMFLLKNND
ncbi:Dimodular nonribosomal peptide synthase [Porphyromonas gingivalis]|nr:Dimodular nonribosomal peptide synthase [Porphyromonas gingivalis]